MRSRRSWILPYLTMSSLCMHAWSGVHALCRLEHGGINAYICHALSCTSNVVCQTLLGLLLRLAALLQGAPSSLKSEDVNEAALEPHVIDTVVEGRLGGGEETIYSPADGPPLDMHAPKPRSS